MNTKVYVKVRSGVRLHVQLIDPAGISGFKRGGLGFALDKPSVHVVVTTLKDISEAGFVEDTLCIKELALEKDFDEPLNNIKVFIKSEIPRHVGLGSGTICRTLIRKAVSEILGISSDIFTLASLTGVGQYTTLKGGLVIVSPTPIETSIPSQILKGNKGNRNTPSLLASLKLPKSWKAIVCIPKKENVRGLSGAEEFSFYSSLEPPSINDVQQVCFEILAKLIPAIQTENFIKFEEALSTLTTLCWKKQEKCLNRDYWDKTSRALYNAGAKFVGVTSGGPTTFTIMNGEKHNMSTIKAKLVHDLLNDSEIVISSINNPSQR